MAFSGARKSPASPPSVMRVREGRVREGRNSLRGARDVKEGDRSRLVPPISSRNSLKKRAGDLASTKFPKPSLPGLGSRTKPSSVATTRRNSLFEDPGGLSPSAESKVDRALENTEELLERFRQLNILPNEMDLSDSVSTAGRSRCTTQAEGDTCSLAFSQTNSLTFRHEDPEFTGLLHNISEVNRLMEDLAAFGEQFQDKQLNIDSLAQSEIERIEGSACSPSVARTLAQWPVIKELAILGQKIRDSEIDTASLKDRLRSMSCGSDVLGEEVAHRKMSEGTDVTSRCTGFTPGQGSHTLSVFSPKSCVIDTRSPGSAERAQSAFRELDPKALTEIVPQIPVLPFPMMSTTYGFASDLNGNSHITPPVALPASSCLSRPARLSLPNPRDMIPQIAAAFHGVRPASMSVPVAENVSASASSAPSSPNNPTRRGATISAPCPEQTPECPVKTLDIGTAQGVQSPSLAIETSFFGTPRSSPRYGHPGESHSPPPCVVGSTPPRVHRHTIGSPRSLHFSRVPAPTQAPQEGAALGLHRAWSPQAAVSCGTPGQPTHRARTISPTSRKVCLSVTSTQRDRSREASPSLWTPRPGCKASSLAPTPLIQARSGPSEGRETTSSVLTGSARLPAGPASIQALGSPTTVRVSAGWGSLGVAASIQTPGSPPASLRVPPGVGTLRDPAGKAHVGTANSGGPASVPFSQVVRLVSAPTTSGLQCRKESGAWDVPLLQASVKQQEAETPSPTKYVWEAVHTTTYRLRAVTEK